MQRKLLKETLSVVKSLNLTKDQKKLPSKQQNKKTESMFSLVSSFEGHRAQAFWWVILGPQMRSSSSDSIPMSALSPSFSAHLL